MEYLAIEIIAIFLLSAMLVSNLLSAMLNKEFEAYPWVYGLLVSTVVLIEKLV